MDEWNDRPGIAADANRARRRWSPLPWLIAAMAVAFAFGLITNPWFERNVRARLPGAMQDSPIANPGLAARLDAQARQIATLDARLDALEAQPNRQAPAPSDALAAPSNAPPSERLVRVETRVEALDRAQLAADRKLDELQVAVAQTANRTEAALAGATAEVERAQAALLLASVRRTLEAGRPLGPLETALRRMFGDSPAVEAVAALGRSPATPRSLHQELAHLRQQLAERRSGSGGGLWRSISEGLADVVAVRRTDVPAIPPSARIDRAARLLDVGDVAGALAQVDALPPPARVLAASWRASARRQIMGMRALSNLEILALDRPMPAAPAATHL